MSVSVHPHSRGEHIQPGRILMAASGSSPLARGTLAAPNAGLSLGRFIPTRAGNTHLFRGIQSKQPVHPHSRGEHSIALSMSSPAIGSSPLARGTHSPRLLPLFVSRFIPTRAGNTATLLRLSSFQPVHPHSRGEHSRIEHWGRTAVGSSPLARGTLSSCNVRSSPRRFIPTRAGNTQYVRNTDSAFGGSSPLARGTPLCLPSVMGWLRFIPTRAGNT